MVLSSDAEASATLYLLDQNKNNIFNLTLTKEGNVYKTSFKAPKTAGVYYVHIDAKGAGLAFAGEKNINILSEKSSDQELAQDENIQSGAVVVDSVGEKEKEVKEVKEGADNGKVKSNKGFLELLWQRLIDYLYSFFWKSWLPLDKSKSY